MKKLRNHLIGVDQGTKILFSDFENGGEMWSGSGSRRRSVSVEFKSAFKTIPIVHVPLDMWDMDQETNQRADITTEKVTKRGFDIVFKTWGDTKIARVRAAWFAIGELSGEDEWSLS
jgi:hypothetical protein